MEKISLGTRIIWSLELILVFIYTAFLIVFVFPVLSIIGKKEKAKKIFNSIWG